MTWKTRMVDHGYFDDRSIGFFICLSAFTPGRIEADLIPNKESFDLEILGEGFLI